MRRAKSQPLTQAQIKAADERAEMIAWLIRRGWRKHRGGSWKSPVTGLYYQGREYAVAAQIKHERQLDFIRRNP